MRLHNLKFRKKLIFAFLISFFIQIFLIIGFNYFNWISQISQNTFFYEFLRSSLEPYQDYQIWYKSFVENLLHENWIPYTYFFPDIEGYTNWFSYLWDLFVGFRQYYYIYPPFFLYIITLPGLIDLNLIFIPLLISTNLLPIIIYKFLLTQCNVKVAEWGFLTTIFCPLLIFYNGGLLLNTSLVTCFFIITLYFISIKKYKSACILLATSFLFKQIVIFFILPILAYIVIESSKNKEGKFITQYFKNLLIYSTILSGTILIGSLPWIIINPRGYINSIFVTQGFTFLPDLQIPNSNSPVHWYSFLVGLNLPYWTIYIVGFLSFSFIGIFVIEIIIIMFLHYWYYQKTLNWLKFLDIITYTAFSSHLFLPRGVYKYYFTFHVPIIILWLCFHFKDLNVEKNIDKIRWSIYFLGTSLIILVIPRNFYLLVIWVIIILIINKNIKINQTYYVKSSLLE
ncbi:MAG: hypothetical protein ACFFA4_06400 [Promethearchaeota archaeon]